MPVEAFRGYVAALVAALLALGSLVGAAWAWSLPADAANPRDLALIFGLFGTAFGAATSWLFVSEGASRASHAAMTAHAAGVESVRPTGGSGDEIPPIPASDPLTVVPGADDAP